MTLALPLLAAALVAPTQMPAPDPAIRFGRFGTVSLYRPSTPASSVAIFFSGDGGWQGGVTEMARAIASSGTLVIGVDTPAYLKQVDRSGERCGYFAGDAEQLSQYVQKRLGLPRYQPPALLGYSSGAGLAYGALAQAPDNTFRGAVSIGFDPLLPARTAPCARNGLTSAGGPGGRGRVLAPVGHLPAPWIVLQGELDRVSPYDSAEAFVRAVPGGEFLALKGVGHGFTKEASWIPQLQEAVGRLALRVAGEGFEAPGDLTDLPVVTLPPPPPSDDGGGDYFAIVLSGDGGWASIDKQIGEELVRSGVPAVGFNSLQYFWRKRTPEESAADLERMIRHYRTAFHRRQVVLAGYSRGADVLPLMASRLPGPVLDQVRLLAFLGLAHETDLEFRLGDWLGARHDATYKLLPELMALRGRRMLCVYGSRESDSLCPGLPAGLADVVRIEGGHHFDGDFRGLARLILAHADRDPPPP